MVSNSSRKTGRELKNLDTDQGSGTVTAVALISVIILLTLAVVGFAQALSAHAALQRNTQAAVLAAAQKLNDGGLKVENTCDFISSLSGAYDFEVRSCQVLFPDVRIQTKSFGKVFALTFPVHARARAGPVPEAP